MFYCEIMTLNFGKCPLTVDIPLILACTVTNDISTAHNMQPINGIQYNVPGV